MGEITDYSKTGSSSGQEVESGTVPKVEVLSLEFPSETGCSRHFGDNVASSSGSNLRSSFIGMGFLPSLVDKVIEEKGEDDVDLLLETLFAYSDPQKSNSESSDSIDGLFDDGKDESSPAELGSESHPKEALLKSNSDDSLDSLFDENNETSRHQNVSAHIHPKEESDISTGVHDDKRAFLLSMNFSVNEVNFAMDKLGGDTPINELVDFIIAAQMAENFERDSEHPIHGDQEMNETMDKTLRLLEMGFSENEISSAIEKFGSEIPIAELADLIFAGQIAGSCPQNNQYSSTNGPYNDYGPKRHSSDTFAVKKEEYDPDAELRDFDFDFDHKGKRPKQESFDDSISSARPTWLESRKGNPLTIGSRTPLPRREFSQAPERPDKYGMPKLLNSSPSKSLNRMVAKPPYFFYGNVVNITPNNWAKISQFLYHLEPEYVNTQFFSAFTRKEGYVHNLPTEDRFHILPKPPMNIEDAIPHTRKWWPSWDTRKQLTCLSTETSGIFQLCDRLGKMLTSCQGLLSVEQQRDILHHCRTLNLVWVGEYKLGPVEPEHLECILGYPARHTQDARFNLIERLQSLKYCFQTDTLGYHLSVLKNMFPEGLTVLSVFSGIGGAEVTLHRLGIRLKGVVSVETCERKRDILLRWWRNSGQTGDLVQIEDIQKLASNKLESLIERFGGFDFVICQNRCVSSSNSKIGGDSDSPGFDFSLFYEFVRVLHSVRSKMERKR
uniref:Domain rearranged methyltransferase n=1 Tax=Paeonia suffruticosa TaxID=45171 RepID=A0A6G5T5A2_PAESU|nr:domain rearranged methyltransferase [Paeonia suffruticosa]